MNNMIDIGARIAELRREKGLTQEGLIEIIGDDLISLSTLKRIEGGTGHLDFRRLDEICEALGCRVQDLLYDEDIRTAMKDFIIECGDEVGEEEEGNIDFYIKILNLCYPKVPDDFLFDRFTVTNLMQFIIYLPLMNVADLSDCLWRIYGDTFRHEYYVLEKIEYLIKNIPDCNAKRYADILARRCNTKNYIDFYTSKMTEEDEAVSEEYTDEELWEMSKDYGKILESYRDAFHYMMVFSQIK